MKIIGNTTIHPLFFFTGKISGYITWLLMLLSILGIDLISMNHFTYTNYISLGFLVLSIFFIATSFINLGNSISLGLPEESTEFKNKGVYKISRNPMYVGFNFLTISAIIYSMNIVVLILGLYSMVIYHFIIKGEEHFLEGRFGNDYSTYKTKVRRYL